MTAAGIPVKDCFIVSAIASTLYEAATFPGPSLDRRRIACLYQDPPMIWAQHFTHLINSLHGALHIMPAVLKTERQTVSARQRQQVVEHFHCSERLWCSDNHESSDAPSGDRKRLRPPFRSLKTARSQHITSKASTSGSRL
jgi:hypothetical protein